MLRLVARFDRLEASFALPKAPAVLGADPSCELHLPLPGVSRRHAMVTPETGTVRIVDLDSKNGLGRGGQRLAEVVLAPGERVRIGRATLTLEETSTADVELGATLQRTHRPVARPGETGPATPDLDSDGTALREAMALVRDLQRGGRGEEILARLRDLLEATAIGVVRPEARVSGEIGFERLVGPPPAEEELASALANRNDRAQWQTGVLQNTLSWWPASATRACMATFPASSSQPSAWQLDLFEYVAEVLDRTHRPPGRPGSRPAAATLVFPEEFVAGESAAMKKLLAVLEPTASSTLDVLILGETGTGKELVARTVHASGPTAGGPFVAINCAAIPAELLEAELFGVEARVATGVDPRPGLFVKADGGSLFLDEIGDMADALQAKLLRALQEREVLPLGGSKPRKVRLRVISASNKEIVEFVRQGRFRADLYYRLRGLQFHLPPLRERPEDIPALATAFVGRAADAHGKEIRGITRKALQVLAAHQWPGNIRELKSELERAVLVAPDGAAIDSTHLGPVRWLVEQAQGASGDRPTASVALGESTAANSLSFRALGERIATVEHEAIREALARTGGNQTEAAKLLGITRNGLALKLSRLGLTKTSSVPT